ncbi:MAG: amino acid adenylation domain-containing protein, partial [Clostridia bacterium]|nr:amino acid adenylation domain-containing protein [Clostridia bacterium]
LQYLEKTAARLPDKVAITCGGEQAGMTFAALSDAARRIGSALCRRGLTSGRVALLMERRPSAVTAMLGAVYAGACYVPLDTAMPPARLSYILSHSSVTAIVTDRACEGVASTLGVPTLCYEALVAEPVDGQALDAVRRAQTAEDEMYIIFTSGSTGRPKGVVGCHRAVIDYAEALTAALGFDEHCVFGCQSPLYFDAPFKELLTTLKCGATTVLLDKRLFSFPVLLLRALNENKINTVCWVSSALSSAAVLGALDAVPLTTLETVVFGSEVLPPMHLRTWQNALPTARFWQLYGPTEATGMSCFFAVDRTFSDNERIPIGRPLEGTGLLLLDENGEPAAEGEIILFGDCLTLGYDNDAERTAAVFTPYRFADGHVETVYRTGDLARYNERGELVFLGRRDGQIKRMGHRFETGELEAVAQRLDGVTRAVALARAEDADLVLAYTGDASEREVLDAIRAELPRYFLPRLCRRVDTIPLTDNGKIDRQTLWRLFTEET